MSQNFKNHPHSFDVYEVNYKSVWVIFPDFVALSEYIDFTYIWEKNKSSLHIYLQTKKYSLRPW